MANPVNASGVSDGGAKNYQLGCHCVNQKNYPHAMVFFKWAAEQGHVESNLRVALCYDFLEDWHSLRAIKWYQAWAKKCDPKDLQETLARNDKISEAVRKAMMALQQ